VIYPDITTFDASGPPILGDVDGGMPSEDDKITTRWVFGEPSSDSDEVMGCSPREGGDGVIAGIRGRPGIGIGIGRVDVVETGGAAEVVLASCASLASRMAATHVLASSCDSACR
jgi:hypothetical protein